MALARQRQEGCRTEQQRDRCTDDYQDGFADGVRLHQFVSAHSKLLVRYWNDPSIGSSGASGRLLTSLNHNTGEA